jgi:flagellar hook-associated protein 2
VRPFGGDVMNNTLLSTISVMNFNNISSVRSSAKKAYSPSTDFIFNNFPVAKSFGDFIDTRVEQQVEDFMEKYQDSSTTLSEVSSDLKQLFLTLNDTKKARVDSDTLEAVAKQDALSREYKIEVTELATNQQSTSNALESQGNNLSEFKTIDFTINQGDQTVDFAIETEDIEDNQAALKKIASNINDSALDLNAKVLTDNEGNSRLSLESEATGTENAFTIEGGAIDFINMTTVSAAKNASYKLDGENLTSDSNTISLDDGNLDINFKEESDKEITLGVSIDTEAIKNNLEALANNLESTRDFLDDYKQDSRLLSKYQRRFDALIDTFKEDLNSVGIKRDEDQTISFSRDDFENNFETDNNRLIEELDKTNGFIDQLDRFARNFSDQDIRTLSPSTPANNLPTFNSDDFISYLSLSRGFNMNAFYPTGGILDFML